MWWHTPPDFLFLWYPSLKLYIWMEKLYMGVSLNGGTPKTPQRIIFSRENPWLLGTTVLGNPRIFSKNHAFGQMCFRIPKNGAVSGSMLSIFGVCFFFKCCQNLKILCQSVVVSIIFLLFSSRIPGEMESNLTCAYFSKMGWLKPPTTYYVTLEYLCFGARICRA